MNGCRLWIEASGTPWQPDSADPPSVLLSRGRLPSSRSIGRHVVFQFSKFLAVPDVVDLVERGLPEGDVVTVFQ